MTPETLTGADVVAIAEARGFTVVVRPGPPPMPVLRDPGGQTPPPSEPLLAALRAYREEIISLLAERTLG